MLRSLLALGLLISCTSGTIKSGGEKRYAYDAQKDYTSESLKDLSDEIIQTKSRDPHIGKLDNLFGVNQAPIRRVGIVIFETEIQPTRGGLAGQDLIYLSEAGKQILTENFLSIWEQSLNVLAPDLDYVPTSEIRKALPFQRYGSTQDDFVKTPRTSLAPDDIFYIESGKKTTSTTVVNARGMRDMSFVLVPAYELMAGPKWSEHNKHFLNDVAKDLKLDAVFIVMSNVSWTAAHTDEQSGEYIPEEVSVKINASTLIPLFRYHERLEKLHINEKPNITLAYRAYDAHLQIPVSISLPEKERSFAAIENELLAPMLKTYKDLSQMTIMRMTEDLKKTW